MTPTLSPSRSASQSSVLSYGLLLVAVFACALSVIFLKSSTTHPFWLSGARLLIAAVALSPLFVIEYRKHPESSGFRSILSSWPGALALAFHFILWTLGARMTHAANGTLIVNLTPVVLPLLMWRFNNERVTRVELIGTLVAMSGVAILVATHYQADPKTFRGDVTCFIALILFCIYIAFGRRHGMGKSLWLYVVPLYAMAGLICWTIALLARAPLPVLTRHEVTMLLCLGLVPTVIGHSIMNWCIRHLRGQIVSTFNLGQVIFAGIIAFFAFGERPDVWFYATAPLIIVGATIVIRANPSHAEPDAES